VLPVSVSKQVLRHDVGEHVGGREVCSFEGVSFAGITEEVEADANMLGALMELRVFLQVGLHLGCRRRFAGAR